MQIYKIFIKNKLRNRFWQEFCHIISSLMPPEKVNFFYISIFFNFFL